MPITRKPTRPATGTTAVDIDALIGKGGSPAQDDGDARSPAPTAAVVLRLPSDMLDKVDESVHSRPIRIPRHTWILEAIHEKLQREHAPF